MSSKKNDGRGSDNSHSLHPLLDFRSPPESLVALREELTRHPDVTAYAIKGGNFEDCLGRIFSFLEIVVDGMYDVPEMCDVLVHELKRRNTIFVAGMATSGAERDPRLMSALIRETKDAVILENRDLIIPEGVRRELVEKKLATATTAAIVSLDQYRKERYDIPEADEEAEPGTPIFEEPAEQPADPEES